MLESRLQKKIIDYLKQQDCWVVKTITTNVKGCPDIIACHPKIGFIAIEVKREGMLRNVTPLQQHHIDTINLRGGLAFAADSLEIVKEKLNTIDN